MTDEEYVRAHWETVYDSSYSLRLLCANEAVAGPGYDHAPHFVCWPAARAFTEQRLEEIRQTEREIELLNWLVPENRAARIRAGATAYLCATRDMATMARVLARTHSHLDSLRKGMRP